VAVGAAAALLVVVAVAFRYLILLGEPICDDELTYRFIAQTLLEGRVVNDPPIDPAFLGNPFIIATEEGWYGKYPIGHPLFLAAGEAVNLRFLVVPLLSAGSLLLTYAIGRRIFSPRVALVGALLLLVSPHFVWSSATELSQPTEAFCVLLGLWCVVKIESEPGLRWAALGGFAFGMAILVRPMPGVLCTAVAGLVFIDVVRRSPPELRKRRLLELGVALLLTAAISAVILLVNDAQSGDSVRSGYHVSHGELTGAHEGDVVATSVGAALMRQSFWLFGIPLSILLVPWGSPRRDKLLFWGIIAAVYAYRVLVPKTVVSTTGPVYVLEIVPLLCLATAAGLARATRRFERLAVPSPTGTAAAVFAAAVSVAVIMFTPVQLRAIHNGAWLRQSIHRQLDERISPDERVLVFTHTLLPKADVSTWAYMPPNPKPDLSDRILFLRMPKDPRSMIAPQALQLWKERYPDRRAFVWGFMGQRMLLKELRPPP
jgi:hypothetical protein